MNLVENKTNVNMEAGEINVNIDNVVTPDKLRLLADHGWSIASAWKLSSGGFNLLLTRPMRSVDHIVHEGTARCPSYCNCKPQSRN